jgi:2-keto-4-pentenoate hydratase/2-oxohepta-3-ene-1,7-dioic acid hydratase in catechol pathway
LLLYRLGPEGFFAASSTDGAARMLHSDPYVDDPETWQLGRTADLAACPLLPPVVPGKIIGIGRNYRAHAEELGNEVPPEPLLFLKSPSSVVGPGTPVVLPPPSRQVEFEGEIAVVLRRTLRHASRAEAERAILGVCCACDVTARDLQRRDATFARAKSFDSFCPLGPAVRVAPGLDDLEVETRVNGERRQRGGSRDMIWGILDLLVYTSSMMTLEPADVVLTGTPAGVGTLAAGDRLEVEVTGVGTLENPVEAWRRS